MYQKIVNKFKAMELPETEREIEDLIAEEAAEVGRLYSQALIGEKLSDVMVKFAQARLAAENLKLIYIATSEIMPEDLRAHFSLGNSAVSYLLSDLMDSFDDLLEKTMFGLLECEDNPEKFVESLLQEMGIENATI